MAADIISGNLYSLSVLLPAQINSQTWRKNWVNFQLNSAQRMRMLNDDWDDLLIQYIATQISEETFHEFFPLNRPPRWPIPIEFNLFKRVITEMSVIYTNEANRWFELGEDAPEDHSGMEITGSDQIVTDVMKSLQNPTISPIIGQKSQNGQPEPDTDDKPKVFTHDERWEQIADTNYNAMLQRVNILVNALNVVLVRPIDDPKAETGFRYNILTPDMFHPITDPYDPTRLIGVIYAIDLTDSGPLALPAGTMTPLTSAPGLPTRLEVLYFIGYDEKMNNGTINIHEPFYAIRANNESQAPTKLPYPYYHDGEPFLPFAVFRKEIPLTYEFVNRTKGDDLVKGTLAVAYLASVWQRLFTSNAFKQVWITGPKANLVTAAMIRDVMSIQTIPGNSQDTHVQLMDWTTDLEGHFNAIQDRIDAVIGNYGMSRDKWKSAPISGESLKVQNEPLLHRIQEQIPLYQYAEKELAYLIRKINNTSPDLPSGKFGKINEDAEFRLEFGDLPFEETVIDTIDKQLMLVQENLLSKAELLLKLSPEVGTIEDAQIQLMRNKQLNRQINGSPMQQMGQPGQPPPPVQSTKPPMPNPLLDQDTQQGPQIGNDNAKTPPNPLDNGKSLAK